MGKFCFSSEQLTCYCVLKNMRHEEQLSLTD